MTIKKKRERIADNFKEFNLTPDAYSLCFRALHRKTMVEKLKLTLKEQNNVLGSAVLVCFLQITLGYVLITNI
jgi:hypothetical protein